MVRHTTVETAPVVRPASVVRAVQRAAPEGRVGRAGTAIVASARIEVSVRSADRAISVGAGIVRLEQAVTGWIVRPEDATVSAAAQTVHRREAPTVGIAHSADRAISPAVTSAPPEATAIVMSALREGAGNSSASRV